MKCICESPNVNLKNQHFLQKNIELFLLEDSISTAIIIADPGKVLAVFTINYCPTCGRRLKRSEEVIKC